MKKALLLFLPIILTLIAFSSCQKDPILPEVEEEEEVFCGADRADPAGAVRDAACLSGQRESFLGQDAPADGTS